MRLRKPLIVKNRNQALARVGMIRRTVSLRVGRKAGVPVEKECRLVSADERFLRKLHQGRQTHASRHSDFANRGLGTMKERPCGAQCRQCSCCCNACTSV